MKRRPFELRGWHVLTLLLGFFGFVIAVNSIFIVLAVKSFPGEEERRSYLQGIQYNRTLEMRREQKLIGWQVEASLRDSTPKPELVIVVRGRDGSALDGLTITGEFQRPTDEKLDKPLALVGRGGGAYVAQFDDLAKGLWRVKARAVDANKQALDFESDLIWKAAS